MIMNDQFYMSLALEQAQKALALDEVPVGAVIVDQKGDVIGKGCNLTIASSDPTGHAEINAIRMASSALKNYRLLDTVLFVTLEPCIMCMGAIIHARIKRVVFGADDPKWGAVKSLYQMAEDQRLNHQPEITRGILKEKSAEIIKDFFRNKRSR